MRRLGRVLAGVPWRAAALGVVLLGVLAQGFVLLNRSWPTPWDARQTAQLRELWLGTLTSVPADPSNRFAEDAGAARLGALLFRDPRLSQNQRVACSSCHRPDLAFSDGRALAQGLTTGTRNTPSVVPAAHAPAYFWDGRRDSEWAQALVPLEGAAEMGLPRSLVHDLINQHYRDRYEQVFGKLPRLDRQGLERAASPIGSPEAVATWQQLSDSDRAALNRVFANVGKALAAYERTLRFGPSRFDRYVSQVLRGNHLLASRLMSPDEVRGIQLFLGKGNCVLCHRGPLFTSHEFFSLGLPFGTPGPDPGRARAFREQQADPFNCAGPFSDARPEQCLELNYLANDELGYLANFKAPSLRNVAITAPYMHAGQFKTLSEVVDHYSRAPGVPFPEHTDIRPLALEPLEQAQLVAFLETLISPVEDPYGGGSSFSENP